MPCRPLGCPGKSENGLAWLTQVRRNACTNLKRTIPSEKGINITFFSWRMNSERFAGAKLTNSGDCFSGSILVINLSLALSLSQSQMGSFLLCRFQSVTVCETYHLRFNFDLYRQQHLLPQTPLQGSNFFLSSFS